MDGTADRPLDGTTVVDFSHYIAGSFATAMLADLGARVIKVESTVHIDGIRRRGPVPGRATAIERPGAYQFIHGKQSVDVNFRTPEGRAAVLDLVRKADIVVENFRHGTLDRADLGYPVLAEANPDIILASIRAFLSSGRLRDVRAGAPAVQALTGVDSGIGYPDGPPLALGRPMGDTVAGLYTAVGLLAALRRRRGCGHGDHLVIGIDRALVAAFAAAPLTARTAGAPAPTRAGNDRPGMAPNNFYRCAGQDTWLSIACRSEADWHGLVGALGAPAWTEDERFADRFARVRHRHALDGHLAEWCRDQDPRAAADRLQSFGVAAVPLAGPAEQLADPHLAARGLVTWLDHAEIGRHPVVNTMFHLASAPSTVTRAAPAAGQDTATVLGR
jgi:crotonobetainyl-CoA:carnitine CoA-transferase CaiB-like acyl-CoA transferase